MAQNIYGSILDSAQDYYQDVFSQPNYEKQFQNLSEFFDAKSQIELDKISDSELRNDVKLAMNSYRNAMAEYIGNKHLITDNEIIKFYFK